MKNKELQEYLQLFPEDAQVGVILANFKKRKFYQVAEIGCAINPELKAPIIEIAVGNEKNFEEVIGGKTCK